MIEAADRNRIVFQVGHSHSYDEPYRAMRDGDRRAANSDACASWHNMYYSDWVYRPRRPEELDERLGGGITFPQGAHQFDILRLARRRSREERARANVRLGSGSIR